MKAENINKIAVIGGGVIGSSWATLFAVKGLMVSLYDLNDECIAKCVDNVAANLDSLAKFGAINISDVESIKNRISFTTSIAEAVKDAGFIQENGPERIAIKQSILAEIEQYAADDAIYATSSSGLPITEITANAVHPERCVGGHPYNPPHLIPLVEMTYTEGVTDMNALEAAKEFYQSVGKEPIILNKPVPGYIANRLQLAIYREMVDLTMKGVCSPADADKALTFGPGIRWGIFGHNMVMQLGNPGGLKGMLQMLGPAGDYWLADMADWKHIPDEYADIAQASIDEVMANNPDYIGHNNQEIAKYRDQMLIDILKLHKKF